MKLVSNGVAMLDSDTDSDADESDGGDIANAPWEMMKDGKRLLLACRRRNPRQRQRRSIVDLCHNLHLERGARRHKLRVHETLTDPTGREVCGYLLVQGSVHAHAYGWP